MSGHWNEEDNDNRFVFEDVFGNEIAIGKGYNDGQVSIYIWAFPNPAPILLKAEDIIPFAKALQDESNLAIAQLGQLKAKEELLVCQNCSTIIEPIEVKQDKCNYCYGY